MIDFAGLNPRSADQAFFRFREVADKVVITNLEGNHLLLSPEDFARFARGEVEDGSELWQRLDRGNFLRSTFDVEAAAARFAQRKSFVGFGPILHILVVTLRCNETCIYCHASRADMHRHDTDMTPEIADQALDLIFQTTSDFVTIEFQGGEPLANYSLVQHVIKSALEKNRDIGKRLEFTMVSNLSLMDEDKLSFLLEHKVQICTSIDGPRALHDAQRRLPRASAFDATAKWIRRINERYEEIGLDPTLYHVEALVTTTKATLGHWQELIDTYVGLGCRSLFLRPVDPFGFASRSARAVAFEKAEFLEFYRRAVDYMLQLNSQGVEILERYAAIFLTKILAGHDPNFLDIRSPAGAGIGGLTYNYDGRIFTCDEGRMLDAMNDATFEIGHVAKSSYRDLVGHETVRSLALATNLDSQPDCVQCAYNPFCGTNGAYNHRTQGSLFGRMRDNGVCALHKGIQDVLFTKLAEADPQTLETFERWTTVRPREHFVHEERYEGDLVSHSALNASLPAGE